MHLFGAALQQTFVQRHFDDHALFDIGDGGYEDGGVIEAGHLLHFRQVLVAEVEVFRPGGGVSGVVTGLGPVVGDHRLTAAAVAGDGVDIDRVIARQQAGAHQRLGEQRHAGRVATGVGDAVGGAQLFALTGQFRYAVHPAGGNTCARWKRR